MHICKWLVIVQDSHRPTGKQRISYRHDAENMVPSIVEAPQTLLQRPHPRRHAENDFILRPTKRTTTLLINSLLYIINNPMTISKHHITTNNPLTPSAEPYLPFLPSPLLLHVLTTRPSIYPLQDQFSIFGPQVPYLSSSTDRAVN